MLTLLLSLAATPPSAMLPCDERYRMFEAAKSERVPTPRTAIDVQVTALESLCRGWEVIDLWRTWSSGADRQPIWHGWRKRMDARGDVTAAELDSIGCPALTDRLERLKLVPVTLDPGPLHRGAQTERPSPPPLPPAPDGTDYAVTMPSAPQQAARPGVISNARVSVSTSYGPFADWAMASRQALEVCWRQAG